MEEKTEDRLPVVEAAVLVPVYRGEDGDVRIVLVRRSNGVVHGGEIAFPGGKCDPEDRSFLETALREAGEEVGIEADSVEVLRQLPPVETRTTGFRITPFLARIKRPHTWIRDQREIAEVLDIPLKDFHRPDARGEEMRQFEGAPEPERVPFYRIGGSLIWGATYRILHRLISGRTIEEYGI